MIFATLHGFQQDTSNHPWPFPGELRVERRQLKPIGKLPRTCQIPYTFQKAPYATQALSFPVGTRRGCGRFRVWIIAGDGCPTRGAAGRVPGQSGGGGTVPEPGLLVLPPGQRQQLDATIAKAGPARGGPDLSADGATLRVGSGAAGAPSLVWLVHYDPRVRQVPIKAGENGGRTLPHRDIVREMVKLGSWNGSATTFALPAAGESGLASAVLVQRDTGGPITAALKI